MCNSSSLAMVNSAMFVLPAPVGAQTSMLLLLLYALLNTTLCTSLNCFNPEKIPLCHCAIAEIGTSLCRPTGAGGGGGTVTSSTPLLQMRVVPDGSLLISCCASSNDVPANEILLRWLRSTSGCCGTMRGPLLLPDMAASLKPWSRSQALAVAVSAL